MPPIPGVYTGFRSPAEEYRERSLNLHDHLVPHPDTTFFLRASGDALASLGIRSGDLLIVDRSLFPRDGSLVLAVTEGRFSLRRMRRLAGRLLYPDHPLFPARSIEPDPFEPLEVWGVLTTVIHAL